MQLKTRGSLHSQEIRGGTSNTRGTKRREGEGARDHSDGGGWGAVCFGVMTWCCRMKIRDHFKTNFRRGALKMRLKKQGSGIALLSECQWVTLTATFVHYFQLYVQVSTGSQAETAPKLRATLWSSGSVLPIGEDFTPQPDNGLQREMNSSGSLMHIQKPFWQIAGIW